MFNIFYYVTGVSKGGNNTVTAGEQTRQSLTCKLAAFLQAVRAAVITHSHWKTLNFHRDMILCDDGADELAL